MALMASAKSFTPAPEGVWPAVCVDIVDLGMQPGPWGTKRKCKIVWEIGEKMSDGRPFIASKWYTVSLHEKASLHKHLKSWRGRAFTADELKGFDLEKLIGAPCQILIEHQEKEGVVYSNVSTILRAQKNAVLQPSGKYIRSKDRQTTVPLPQSVQPVSSGQSDYDETEEEPPPMGGDFPNDDIPF